MAVTLATSGSTTPTVGTESSLYSTTTAGNYAGCIDTTNMVNGDTVEIRVYGKARSTDTKAIIYFAAFSNVQIDPLKLSIVAPTPHYWEVSIKQTEGTAKAFAWGIYQQ